MKRPIAFLLLGLVAAGLAVAVQQVRSERQYRQLLADGEAALARGQGYVAVELFTGALTLRPRSMVAYYHRGEAYRQQRQYDAAIRDLREAARLSPAAPQPLITLGELYDERADPAHAADWYAQAADRLQDADPGLLYSLALARYRAGAPAAAREPLRRALAQDDSNAEGQYLLALVSRDTQDIDEAVARLERAVRLAPALLPAREELADLYREQGRPADELAQLRALAALDDRVDRHVAVGLVEDRLGQSDAALDTLNAAAATAPNDSRVWLAIARVLLSRGERSHDASAVARALPVLERALGGTARRSEGLALYGRALDLSGDLAGAERILQSAIATSPIDAEAFDFLADVAERASHPQIARDALLDLDALEGDTATPAARATRVRRIGVLSLAAGDAATAAAYLRQTVGAAPDDVDALQMLAQACWQLGDADAARSAIDRALDLAPGDPALARVARAIRSPADPARPEARRPPR